MRGVITEIPRWIFRGDSILLAALGLFGIAWLSGHSLKVPTGPWSQLLGMASCNIVGWNMFAIYGLSLLPSEAPPFSVTSCRSGEHRFRAGVLLLGMERSGADGIG